MSLRAYSNRFLMLRNHTGIVAPRAFHSCWRLFALDQMQFYAYWTVVKWCFSILCSNLNFPFCICCLFGLFSSALSFFMRYCTKSFFRGVGQFYGWDSIAVGTWNKASSRLKKIRFLWFGFFVLWHINLRRLFNAKVIFVERYLTHIWGR